jgi:hypothetical protein
MSEQCATMLADLELPPMELQWHWAFMLIVGYRDGRETEEVEAMSGGGETEDLRHLRRHNQADGKRVGTHRKIGPFREPRQRDIYSRDGNTVCQDACRPRAAAY